MIFYKVSVFSIYVKKGRLLQGNEKKFQDLFSFFTLHTFQKKPAYLVKQIERQGDQEHCHKVWRGYDSRQQQNCQQGIFAVSGQQFRTEQPHLAEHDRQNRKLEN